MNCWKIGLHKLVFVWLTSNWEFGFDKDGKIILADEFSPDNCRLWDAEGHHMDKDVFRRDLGSLTDVYKVVLEKFAGLEVTFYLVVTTIFK